MTAGSGPSGSVEFMVEEQSHEGRWYRVGPVFDTLAAAEKEREARADTYYPPRVICRVVGPWVPFENGSREGSRP